MDIKEDITALRQFLGAVMPVGTAFAMQNLPAIPEKGTLSIEIVAQNVKEITAAHTRVERDYRLVYFGKSNIDVLDVSDILRKNITNQTKMTVGTGHMTLGAFSMSQVFKTENNVDTAIFMLRSSFVEVRTIESSPKIGEIGIILTPTNPSNPTDDKTGSGGNDPNNPPVVEIPIEVVVPCSIKGGTP